MKTVSCLGIVVLLAGCASPRSMDLETLLARHAEARGGPAVIENLRSMRVDLEITEPGFTVTGRYVAAREGYARIDIYADGSRVFTEAVSPDGGWQWSQGQAAATDLSADGEATLRKGLVGNLYALHQLPALGYELSLAGRVRRDDQEFWAIDQTAPDGEPKRIMLDTESFLVVRELENSALHPDIDATVQAQETVLADHRATDGIVLARREETRDRNTGELLQRITVTNVEINPPIDTAAFTRPH